MPGVRRHRHQKNAQGSIDWGWSCRHPTNEPVGYSSVPMVLVPEQGSMADRIRCGTAPGCIGAAQARALMAPVLVRADRLAVAARCKWEPPGPAHAHHWTLANWVQHKSP